MHFSIVLSKQCDEKIIKHKIRYYAIQHVLSCDFKDTERQLNKLLKEKYELKLRDICLLIIYKSKIERITPSEYTVFITDPKLDQLARLITFGNGLLKGSNILTKAFDWKGE